MDIETQRSNATKRWWASLSHEERAAFIKRRADARRIHDGLNKSARHRLKDLRRYREKKAEYARTEEQREKRRLYMIGWRERNRDKHNEYHRKYHRNNKHKHVDSVANYRLVKIFGVTLAEKKAMLEEQGGRCLICGGAMVMGRKCHIDHDHSTGAIRGLLCGPCNTRLGWYETNVAAIVVYLSKR